MVVPLIIQVYRVQLAFCSLSCNWLFATRNHSVYERESSDYYAGSGVQKQLNNRGQLL